MMNLYETLSTHIANYNVYYFGDLQTLNDNQNIEREIIHFINFKTKQDLDFFLNEITALGFECLDTFYQPQNEYPFSTEIMRTDKTNQENIRFFTSEITKIALKHNGIYKKWETISVSNDEEWQEYLKSFTE